MWDGIKEIFKLLKVGKRKKKWHKLHPNSDTTPMNDFDFEHVLIGKGTYGELNVVDFGGNAKLIINNYVSIWIKWTHGKGYILMLYFMDLIGRGALCTMK